MKYTLKTMKVLQKGDMMTKSDIEYLLKREVSRSDIAKALGMKTSEFNYMWLQMKGPKKSEEDKNKKRNFRSLDITKEKYLNYRKQGYSEVEIARLEHISRKTLFNWRLKMFTDKELEGIPVRRGRRKRLKV
ncbi:hypothetical protein [Heyndrickxia camelliae]|uniref:Uncharacterized protein n=1 Tax=Heyndrickxia camelliae TaxID=1707093 RepID=A0A2N3LNC2_9BACI|nr:hypothetical protein [Heyndrickxia camelliae]PKR86120.1 hypothetical protein CWO92_07035 [Heyndrickxia camelliae]